MLGWDIPCSFQSEHLGTCLIPSIKTGQDGNTFCSIKKPEQPHPWDLKPCSYLLNPSKSLTINCRHHLHHSLGPKVPACQNCPGQFFKKIQHTWIWGTSGVHIKLFLLIEEQHWECQMHLEKKGQNGRFSSPLPPSIHNDGCNQFPMEQQTIQIAVPIIRQEDERWVSAIITSLHLESRKSLRECLELLRIVFCNF